MQQEDDFVARKKTARLAGALYLLIGLTAPFSLIYVPTKLFVAGNAAATAHNIVSSEMMFRSAIAIELIGTVIFLFVVMTLYRLFSGVNKNLAVLMAVLALCSIPISFLNLVNEMTALTLFRGGDFLSAISKEQLDVMGMLFLRRYTQGVVVNQVFWGRWLFPFGMLVMRSGFIPRIFGVLLIINGFAYPIVTLTSLLLPAYSGVVNRLATIPETGELWIMLYLLIVGIKPRTLVAVP